MSVTHNTDKCRHDHRYSMTWSFSHTLASLPFFLSKTLARSCSSVCVICCNRNNCVLSVISAAQNSSYPLAPLRFKMSTKASAEPMRELTERISSQSLSSKIYFARKWLKNRLGSMFRAISCLSSVSTVILMLIRSCSVSDTFIVVL